MRKLHCASGVKWVCISSPWPGHLPLVLAQMQQRVLTLTVIAPAIRCKWSISSWNIHICQSGGREWVLGVSVRGCNLSEAKISVIHLTHKTRTILKGQKLAPVCCCIIFYFNWIYYICIYNTQWQLSLFKMAFLWGLRGLDNISANRSEYSFTTIS